MTYSKCACSCALLLTIFGTVLLRHKSYKYHDKLVFVPSALYLLLVNFTSETSYKACTCWPIFLVGLLGRIWLSLIDLMLRWWYSVWMASLTQLTRQKFAKTDDKNLQQHYEVFPLGHVNWQLNGLSQIYCSS